MLLVCVECNKKIKAGYLLRDKNYCGKCFYKKTKDSFNKGEMFK